MSRVLERRPLRDDVYADLRERIVHGEFASGARLSDVPLSSELGVSRTPVREALLRLTQAGFLEADVGRGFTVRALSAQDVRNSYPIVATLECLALRTSRIPSAAQLALLDRINARMARADVVLPRRLELDDEWHATLLASCENEQLMAMIRALKDRLQRYEYAYAHRYAVSRSTLDHDVVTEALRASDVAAAERALSGNWHGTMDRLVPWLDGIATSES